MHIEELPKEGFAKIKTVLSVFPISRTQFYDGIKDGIYPKPIKLGKRSVAWRVSDIRELIKKANNGELVGSVNE